MERISARSNALIAHIRKLQADKSYRRLMGEYVCEGPKLLDEAKRHGAEILTLVYAEDQAKPHGIAEATRTVCVPADLLTYIADTKTPQGLVFVCRLPQLSLQEPLERGNYLVLDGIQDPGNLGTIWRTADAFGAQAILLLPLCADPYSPKSIRAGMGASFRLPVREISPQELDAACKAAQMPLYATALREDAKPLGAVPLQNSAVVIGSEGRGISDEVLALCAQSVKIPMRARCESLNAAVAAAVILWEMASDELREREEA